MVVANAAAALWVAGKADSLSAASHLAQQAIDSGAAKTLLERLIVLTNQNR
jgi:anthranilate phosphoribosyltransferase